MLSTDKKKQIRETAAAWFYRLQQMESDHPDRSRFEAWLLESTAHQTAFQEVEEISQKLNSMHEVARLSSALKHNQMNKRSSRIRTSFTILGAALCFVAGHLGYQHWQTQPLSQISASASVGQTNIQQLEDGSRLTINSKSELEITYYRDKRLAKLKHGEVIFEVVPDENRPFIVDSGSTKITVLGTRFAVNRLSNMVRVSVDHGRVKVESQQKNSASERTQNIILTDQQVAEVIQQRQPVRVNRAAEDGFSFAQGLVTFDNSGIEEITETLARYREEPIRLEHADLVPQKISARISAKNIEAFLPRLPRLMPVQVTTELGQTIISGQKKNNLEKR